MVRRCNTSSKISLVCAPEIKYFCSMIKVGT
ncbi:hypothetical protein VCHC42A1_1594, partial [Vibrio cholerae HC-42A1]